MTCLCPAVMPMFGFTQGSALDFRRSASSALQPLARLWRLSHRISLAWRMSETRSPGRSVQLMLIRSARLAFFWISLPDRIRPRSVSPQLPGRFLNPPRFYSLAWGCSEWPISAINEEINLSRFRIFRKVNRGGMLTQLTLGSSISCETRLTRAVPARLASSRRAVLFGSTLH